MSIVSGNLSNNFIRCPPVTPHLDPRQKLLPVPQIIVRRQTYKDKKMLVSENGTVYDVTTKAEVNELYWNNETRTFHEASLAAFFERNNLSTVDVAPLKTRHEFSKDFSNSFKNDFAGIENHEKKCILNDASEIRYSLTLKRSNELHEINMIGSYFNRAKYESELQETIQKALNPHLGGFVQTIIDRVILTPMHRNVEARNYFMTYRNVLYDFYSCVIQLLKQANDDCDSDSCCVIQLIKQDDYSDSDDESESDDDEKKNSLILPNVPIDNINLCFVGGVSTGKSTILNAIFCEELTQCKIKRTTMVPTVYIENENNAENLTSPEVIFATISEKNKEIITKTERGEKLNKDEYNELAFNVGKLDINILPSSYVNVYDIPGLNDARTKDVYYSYLDETFTKFNLVVLLVDIHSGLNTSDEIDIVNFITTHTKYELDKNNKQIYTLVVVNKADDMQLDDEDEEETLKLTGELSEMFEQVEKTITTEFERYNIQKHLIGIVPLCAIDSYLYRMVKKHGSKFKLTPEQILKIGINETGKKFSTLKPAIQEKKVCEILADDNFIDTMIKLSGFSRLESMLHKFLNENNVGKKIRIDNLLFEMGKYEDIRETISNDKMNFLKIEKCIQKYRNILDAIKKIDYDVYVVEVNSILTKINSILKELICADNSNKKIELVEYYDKMYRQILEPYFREFVPKEYPTYLKEHIISLINHDIDDKKIQIQSIVDNCNIMKKINIFSKSKVTSLFNRINSNNYKEQTLFTNDKCEYIELLVLLKDCEELKINISSFIRFVLINLYNDTFEEKNLCKKELIFKKHGEIPVHAYLTHKLNLTWAMNMDINMYINGIDSIDFTSDDFILENYYIEYEKKNNSANFINL
jgi:predicted GTPase